MYIILALSSKKYICCRQWLWSNPDVDNILFCLSDLESIVNCASCGINDTGEDSTVSVIACLGGWS